MIRPIDSPEHQVHADGLSAALEDRAATYPHHRDPNPYMRRTRDPLAPAVYPLMVSDNLYLFQPTQSPQPVDYPWTFLEKLTATTVILMVGFILWAASTPIPAP